MENKTENEIIAEFMQHEEGYDEHGHWQKLQYDTSWEWLMPVVEKIETLKGDYTTRIHFNADEGIHFCDIVDSDNYERACQTSNISKIEATFKAVIEFLKWHNDQVKPTFF